VSDLIQMSAPCVSLGLPVYNGQEFIAETVRSIVAQDYKNFELIITDNASTDETEKICREFVASDPRIKYIRNERNLGAGPNYNLGFELGRGEYFKWCAADDCISPDFIGACVAALNEDPDVVLVYGRTETIDKDGKSVPLFGKMTKLHFNSDGVARRFKRDLVDRASNFEIFGVFRSSALRKSTLHRPYYGSDRTLVTELAMLGKFVFLPNIVFYNRVHPGQSIQIHDKKAIVAWQDTSKSLRSKHNLTNWDRLFHLIEIAIRHRDIVSPFKTLGIIFLWSLRPAQAGRLAADLIGMVSPVAQIWLLKSARRTVQSFGDIFSKLQKS
jgi:glycosyltransferase involved in cell wall biosynthesis